MVEGSWGHTSFPPSLALARASGSQTRAWLLLSGLRKGPPCRFGAGLPWPLGLPLWSRPLLAPPSRCWSLRGGQKSCGGSSASTSQRKGLGAWGAMSLRPTEPGGPALHPPTPPLNSPQWLKVRGKGLNVATCWARKLSVLLVLTSIAHLL